MSMRKIAGRLAQCVVIATALCLLWLWLNLVVFPIMKSAVTAGDGFFVSGMWALGVICALSAIGLSQWLYNKVAGTGSCILLIEDTPGCGRKIAEKLAANGHKVVWIAGAERVEDSFLMGILPSPGLDGFDEESWNGEQDRLIRVDYKSVRAALVDGGLIGPVAYGMEFARKLSAFGVPCVSITAGGAGIEPMAQAGCFAGMPKEYVLLAVDQHVLDFGRIDSDPGAQEQALLKFDHDEHCLQVHADETHTPFKTGFPVFDR
jgi:hypothetical protein